MHHSYSIADVMITVHVRRSRFVLCFTITLSYISLALCDRYHCHTVIYANYHHYHTAMCKFCYTYHYHTMTRITIQNITITLWYESLSHCDIHHYHSVTFITITLLFWHPLQSHFAIFHHNTIIYITDSEQ